MSLRLIVTLFFFNSIVLFSQENITEHTIVKGETITSIAEKYDVKPNAIYKLNPNSKNLLKLNSVLLIPTAAAKNTNPKSKITITYPEKEHEVLTKETLYGIAKQYGITLKELNEANPTLESSGLKIGQKINIPGNASSTETASISKSKKASPKENLAIAPQVNATQNDFTEGITIAVLPKESKYSISRKYGITIQELENANPTLGTKALRVGQKISIPGNASAIAEIPVVAQQNIELPKSLPEVIPERIKISPKVEEAVVSQAKTDYSKADAVMVPQLEETENSTVDMIVHEVLPKETKYGVAKEYCITVQELEKQNPEIKNILTVGHKLNIYPGNISVKNNYIVTSYDGNKNSNSFENKTAEIVSGVKPTFNNDFLDQLIERASENIGTRYQTGGTTKSGFDCSGLMCSTFGAFDIKLPRTSLEQSSFGANVNTEEAQKGDLIFFKTNGRSQINHVGMVVEVCEGEIKFIHASSGGGVIISSTREKYYQKNFTKINRVLQ